jgi:hypothetical protein
MASTTKLGISYPDENENPFHVTHATGMGELDDVLAILWEEATLIVVGGGTITLAGGSAQWSAPIYIVSGRTRNTITVPAGSTPIADGEIVSLSGVTRPIANETKSTFSASATGPSWAPALLPLFYRRGNNLYLIRQRVGLELLTLDDPT